MIVDHVCIFNLACIYNRWIQYTMTFSISAGHQTFFFIPVTNVSPTNVVDLVLFARSQSGPWHLNYLVIS